MPSVPSLEIRYHPIRDVLEATPETIKVRTARILRLCREHAVGAITLRSSAIMPWRSPKECVEKVNQWIALVREAP